MSGATEVHSLSILADGCYLFWKSKNKPYLLCLIHKIWSFSKHLLHFETVQGFIKENVKTLKCSLSPHKPAHQWGTSSGLNSCAHDTTPLSTHSCALLQQHTVAFSPPIACSLLCNCYWKCSPATGASSCRIYMTQVHTLESIRKIVHTRTHTYREALEWTRQRRLDLMSAT